MISLSSYQIMVSIAKITLTAGNIISIYTLKSERCADMHNFNIPKIAEQFIQYFLPELNIFQKKLNYQYFLSLSDEAIFKNMLSEFFEEIISFPSETN